MREETKASKLRDLALAIDERAKANTMPGISCPRHIKFEGPGNSSLGTYGDNPVLLEAVKREILREWDRLRKQALDRMDARVVALSADVASFIVSAGDPQTPGPAMEGAR